MATPAFAVGLVWLLFLGLYASTDRPAVDGSTADARQRLRDIYWAEIGVREATGQNDGERVEAYLQYCGLGSGYAWCAAYVSWCFGQAGYEHPRNPWSPALFPAERTVWTREKGGTTPQQGAVFGIYYPALKRIAHVGFIDQVAGSWLVTVYPPYELHV